MLTNILSKCRCAVTNKIENRLAENISGVANENTKQTLETEKT